MIPITQVTREYVQVNSEGYRINSSHWNCSIDQSVVDSILLLRDEFNLGYGTLGKVLIYPEVQLQKSLKDVSAVKPQIVGKQSTKLGRPTVKPDPVIVEKVLEHVANGGTLRAFCRKKGMPSYRTLYRWMSQNNEESKDFLSRFTYTSRFLGARAIAEECLEIIETLPTVIGEGEND